MCNIAKHYGLGMRAPFVVTAEMSRTANWTRSTTIGWLRAILTAAIIVAVGIALLVYLPNAVLTRVHSLNRSKPRRDRDDHLLRRAVRARVGVARSSSAGRSL